MREKTADRPGASRAADGVRIVGVLPESPAHRIGIRTGDRVLSVSGKTVGDLLDLHYRTSRRRFRIRWVDGSGTVRERGVTPGGKPLGLLPEPVRVRRCRNRCIFCFVHQLPKGMRKSLYVKDEDVRLSFLQGNYVTFSDVTEEEIGRILRYRLSPLYVSIHTARPDLRRRMLGNPHARDVLPVIRRLVSAGITLHGQIVVCPGINDGEELLHTLRTLASFRPGLATVAIVPVGLTAHRFGLPPLRPVRPEEARETLRRIASLRRELRDYGEEPFLQAADEYHLLAGRRIPGTKAYGSFAQLGNGVGLLRRFLEESRSLFRRKRWPSADRGGTVITGRSARDTVGRFLEEFSRRSRARFRMVAVKNRLFGPGVTVTGLLGGTDILSALEGKRPGRIFLPSVCLREAGDLFLDDRTPEELSRRTGAEVRLFDPTPRGFFRAVFGAGILQDR
ncbi:MAG: DUF512 domain-containing protein [Deltaproteobacteria bacterium]